MYNFRGTRSSRICVFITIIVALILYIYLAFNLTDDPQKIYNNFKPFNYERVSWEDTQQIYRDSLRVGFGEHGEPGILTDPKEIKKNEELQREFGTSVLISDKISVNRSIPDRRVKGCLNQKYLKNLPQVSIVMIFHNDIFSFFKRTLHSLYNRTPHVLVKELILVNDASTLDYLYKPLEDYIKKNFPNFNTRIINLKKRSGLVTAWLTGFKNATAEYIFCMEAHMEMGYNWLPPLLEPVVLDPHTVAVPTVDGIPGDNLEMLHMHPYRGIFNWELFFYLIDLLPGTDPESTIPHATPTMTGGKFLFKKDYFFELGGYDPNLLIYGSEALEFSLKVNLCGGKLMEVPCSHVGHHYGSFNKYRKLEGVDFEGYNAKRIVEVWFDEFAQYVYKTNPERYGAIDPGDLTEQKAFRATCKPFTYFLEVVAPDLLARYRFEDFVRGTIKLISTNFCVDTMSAKTGNPLGLYECDANSENPRDTQYFELTYFRDIRLIQSQICWDNLINTQNCTRIFGNQTFSYDHVAKRIIQDGTCLEGNLVDKSLRMAPCNENLNYQWQRWEWGFINVTAMENFDKLARKIV